LAVHGLNKKVTLQLCVTQNRVPARSIPRFNCIARCYAIDNVSIVAVFVSCREVVILLLNSLDCFADQAVKLPQLKGAPLSISKLTMQSLGRLYSSSHHTGVCSSRSSRGQAAVVPVPVQQHAAVAACAAPAAAFRHVEAPSAAWGAGSSSILQAGCVVPRPVSSSSSLHQASQSCCCASGLVKACCTRCAYPPPPACAVGAALNATYVTPFACQTRHGLLTRAMRDSRGEAQEGTSTWG
jgi:hypothetical protein